MTATAGRRAYDHRMRDLGRRLYPAKPTEGIRASRPNEYWHIDVTVIKLLDGTRTYLHAAIDQQPGRLRTHLASAQVAVFGGRRRTPQVPWPTHRSIVCNHRGLSFPIPSV
jgi:hypothetical protein